MSRTGDLFDYPHMPGHTEPTTSKEAAKAIRDKVLTLRETVLKQLRVRPSTVHEMAKLLREPVSTVQPRFSELVAKGLIEQSGMLRRNAASGKRAHVWRVVVPHG